MRYYRPLCAIAALTFDLDDTLYDNHPVMLRTEQQTLEFVRRYHPQLASIQPGDFQQMRQTLRAENPEIYHDVSKWRHCAVERLMLNAGLHITSARQGAEATMQHFAHWRSQIIISAETHHILAQLADKWPMAVITNGNAEPHLFGLDNYFRFVLRAGPAGRAKPYSDMYQLACEKLALPAAKILHIGDDLTTDVAGALRHGLQSCWINPQHHNLRQQPDCRLLPHIEIQQLAELLRLL